MSDGVAQVLVLIGSESDRPVMEKCTEMLTKLGVASTLGAAA